MAESFDPESFEDRVTRVLDVTVNCMPSVVLRHSRGPVLPAFAVLPESLENLENWRS